MKKKTNNTCSTVHGKTSQAWTPSRSTRAVTTLSTKASKSTLMVNLTPRHLGERRRSFLKKRSSSRSRACSASLKNSCTRFSSMKTSTSPTLTTGRNWFQCLEQSKPRNSIATTSAQKCNCRAICKKAQSIKLKTKVRMVKAKLKQRASTLTPRRTYLPTKQNSDASNRHKSNGLPLKNTPLTPA